MLPCSTSQSSGLWSQVFNCILAQVCLTVWLLTHPVLISPVLECIMVWKYSATGRIPYYSPVMVGRAKWRPLELLLLKKIVNQKQYPILGEITELSVTTKDLKDSGVVIPTISPFTYLICAEGNRCSVWVCVWERHTHTHISNSHYSEVYLYLLSNYRIRNRGTQRLCNLPFAHCYSARKYWG